MATVDLVLVLLAAVVISNWISRLVPRVAPPLVQIAVGVAMSGLGVDAVGIDPELFFVLFLPPLLFIDGWRFSGRELMRKAAPIASLAVGLVLVTVLCVGPVLHALIPQMPLVATLALAAVVSPTDAIAGSALLKRSSLPPHLGRVVEGEALLNDASALVCLRYVLLFGSAGAPSWPSVFADLVWIGAGGLAIGAAVALAILAVKNAVSARLGETTATQILISLLFPYAAYYAAVAAGASGILAPVAAGMVMGRVELGGRALPLTRLRRTAIWETFEFALNGVIFVLLGEQLSGIIARAATTVSESGHRNPLWLLLYIVAASTALILVRAVWVGAMVAWHERRSPRDPSTGDIGPRAVLALTFSGMRGAVTLAAALALPMALPDRAAFPARDLVIAIAAGVILASLIAANIALPLLSRGAAAARVGVEPPEQRAARLRATAAAMSAVEQAVRARGDGADGGEQPWREASEAVLGTYRRRLDRLGAPDEHAPAKRRAAVERELQITGLRAERGEIAAMVAERSIDDETARRLLLELDTQEAVLAD